MKNNNRKNDRCAVYILLVAVFAALILAAVFLPQIVYGVYDDYQFNLSSNADKNLSGQSQLNKIYEADCSKRLAAYTGGLNSGKEYITIETDVIYDEELDSTIMNLIRSMNEQLFQTTMSIETITETLNSKDVVDQFAYYTLGDAVPLSEEIYFADPDYLFSCVNKDNCRKFMIYDESMGSGIAFSLLYMTIVMGMILR